MHRTEKGDLKKVMEEIKQKNLTEQGSLSNTTTAERNKKIDLMTREEIATVALDLGIISFDEVNTVSQFDGLKYNQLLEKIKERMQLLLKR